MTVEISAAQFMLSDYAIPERCPIAIAAMAKYNGVTVFASTINVHMRSLETGSLLSLVIKDGYYSRQYSDDMIKAAHCVAGGRASEIIRVVELIKEKLKSNY